MFQAMGNTIPSLIDLVHPHRARRGPGADPVAAARVRAAWIWYLSVLSTALQMAMNLVLLQREFRIKLVHAPEPLAVTV